jgi:hypothetical protein
MERRQIMTGGEYDYDQACRAANPAAYAARLTDAELAALLSYAEGIMRGNDTKGGIPGVLKWVCVLEGAKRFFKQQCHDRTNAG